MDLLTEIMTYQIFIVSDPRSVNDRIDNIDHVTTNLGRPIKLGVLILS